LLFAVGALPVYALAVGTRWEAVTFFAGSLFFTSAGFECYREAVDAAPAPGARPAGGSSSSSPPGSTGGLLPCSLPGPCCSTSAVATPWA
jgi:hypothetical protein